MNGVEGQTINATQGERFLDPITHTLSGAVAARALAPRSPGPTQFSHRERVLLGGLAALFPDIDGLIALFADPLVYLSLHRGITHSLVMLPVWATLLGWLAARFWPRGRGQRDWRDAALIIAIGIGIHILGDLITDWGTQLFAPLSSTPLAFPVTFILNPWISLLLLIGTCFAWRSTSRRGARVCLSLVTALVLIQSALYLHAREHAQANAEAMGLSANRVHGQPGPLSPLQWRLIIETETGYWEAYLGFFSRSTQRTFAHNNTIVRHWSLYRPPDALQWHRIDRFGATEQHAFARTAWQRPELRRYRDFTVLPYLWGISELEAGRCAIFADLRLRIEGGSPPPYRYGMCQGADGDWARIQL